MEKFLCCVSLEYSQTAVYVIIALQNIWSLVCISSSDIASAIYLHGAIFNEIIDVILMQVAVIFICVVHYLCIVYIRCNVACPFMRFRHIFKVSCLFYTAISLFQILLGIYLVIHGSFVPLVIYCIFASAQAYALVGLYSM